MTRRQWLKSAAAMALIWAAIPWRVFSREPNIDPQVLREQLIKGLRVTTEGQRDYIDRVVALVAKGKLPASAVYAMFRWSRNRHQRYPFVFFRRGLDTLAAKRGIKI